MRSCFTNSYTLLCIKFVPPVLERLKNFVSLQQTVYNNLLEFGKKNTWILRFSLIPYLIWVPLHIVSAFYELNIFGWRSGLFIVLTMSLGIGLIIWLGYLLEDYIYNGNSVDYLTILVVFFSSISIVISFWLLWSIIIDFIAMLWLGIASGFLNATMNNGSDPANACAQVVLILVFAFVSAFNILFTVGWPFVFLMIYYNCIIPVVICLVIWILKRLMN